MQVLIVSDIHGNLPALERIFQVEKDYDFIVSLGDVVNYGPWSNECVELLETMNNKILLHGNHEEAFIQGFYPGENPIVTAFFENCYADFKYLNAIKTYQLDAVFNGFHLVHTLNDAYIFSDTEVEINENKMIGHSHSQFIKEVNGFTLLNPGSVGQNRKDPNTINYALWETDTHEIELKSLKYDAGILIREMEARNFPAICVNYISNKLLKANEQ